MEIKIKCDGIGPDHTLRLPEEFFDRLAAAIQKAIAPAVINVAAPVETAVSVKARNRERR